MKNKPSDKWAILIGVNRYHESLGPLKYAVNDCRRIAEILKQGQDGFSADHVLLLTDDQPEDRRPTYANIHSWLASWLSQPKEDDTVLVYFSGHGRDLGGKCYLAPGDATLHTMHVTGIPVAHVQDILARCAARQKILILDACHSGAGKDVAAMPGSIMEQIAAGKGIYTITSCDADELSHEWDEKKQGVFSYYLAEALSGACPPDAQGRVTAESLYEWVYDRVRSWAAQKRCSQTPKRFAEGTGIVTVREGEPDWKLSALSMQQQIAGMQQNNSQMSVECPICGMRNPEGETFKCRECGRDYLCRRHFVDEYECCKQCAKPPQSPVRKGINTNDRPRRRFRHLLNAINPFDSANAFVAWAIFLLLAIPFGITIKGYFERGTAEATISESIKRLCDVLENDQTVKTITILPLKFAKEKDENYRGAKDKADAVRRYVAGRLTDNLAARGFSIAYTDDQRQPAKGMLLAGTLYFDFPWPDVARIKKIDLNLMREQDSAIIWSSTWELFRMEIDP
ncbi:MAG: caspase family protein [Thermodesulfobacteriota bacterium]